MSIPIASRSPPSSASIDAEKTSEPPWAIPVSTITSGCVRQMISCSAIMSCGNWIAGRPSQLQLYA